MTNVILKMLLLIIIIGYVVLFISWNPDYVTVCGGVWPPEPAGQRWVEELPIGYLPLIGAALGAVVMAIAAWGEWARQKGVANQSRAQVQKAKAKLQQLADMIKQQRRQISELEKKLAPATSTTPLEPSGEETEDTQEE